MKSTTYSFFMLTLVAILMASCEILDPNEDGLLVHLTVDQDPTLPSIAVNNTMFHAETFGNPDDPMLLVLHGGPGADYRSVLNCHRFSNDGYFVVFYDQRGSGLSQRHDADIYSMQKHVDDLEAVIDHYRVNPDQQIFIIGHSWGAMLATAYVNDYPDRIDGLVLIEPGGFTWEKTLEYINRSRVLNLFGEMTNDYVYLDQFITSDEHNLLDYKADLNHAPIFAEGNVTGDQGPYPFWRSGAVCAAATQKYAEENSFDFTTALDQYTTRVLFLYSELNEAYGLVHAEEVSSAYPSVELVEIKGAGHEVPYFGWANFHPVVLNYLSELN